MEYVVSRAVNQLTQDVTHLDHMGNAILTKSSILEGIRQAVSKRISEAISEILDGDSEIAAMASAIARDVAQHTLVSSLSELNERADARIGGQFKLERDILWRDLAAVSYTHLTLPTILLV